MAKLTRQQIAKLNEQVNNGTILTTVHNSSYHLSIMVNTECVVIRSMLAEDNDKGLLINLSDFRNELENSKNSDKSETSTPEETGSSVTKE